MIGDALLHRARTGIRRPLAVVGVTLCVPGIMAFAQGNAAGLVDDRFEVLNCRPLIEEESFLRKSE